MCQVCSDTGLVRRNCVNYLNFSLLRNLLWLQLLFIFSYAAKMHSGFSWATASLFLHIIFGNISSLLFQLMHTVYTLRH